MDAEQERIERARAKNLAYIQQQDEQQAREKSPSAASRGTGGSKGNSSVYITGLSTYMACKQLEGVCSKIGKVRRIKFYKNERGGLKGDAVVTFASRATMAKAIDRLNHFEVKPGVIITATEATFSSKKASVEENASNFGVFVEDVKDSLALSDVAAASTSLQLAADDTARLELPSRSVILKHIWDPLERSDAAFFEELEEDMRSECGKHGVVEHVQMIADGSMVVRFVELNAAIACLKVMKGRWFGGRQIKAQFDQSKAEDPSDADTKVEAFLASLGE